MAITPGFYILGPAHSLTITRDDTNEQIILDGVRDKFMSKFDDELKKSDPIDNGGMPIGKRIPGGITGTIETERSNGAFDAFMQGLDANYFAGLPDIYCTMIEKIFDADMVTFSVNRYIYVVFHGYNRGSYERTAIVKPSVEFYSSQLGPA